MNRFVETVRHLSLRQIATRAAFMAERAVRRLTAPPPRPWSAPVHTTLTAPEGSRLRAFQVQSFEYARELHADAFRAAAKSWIDAHRSRRGDAWHPYPTSLRIAAWCDALTRFGDDAEIRASVAEQARYLARHLEYDVRGNHLIENARALIRAGAYLHDDALRERGVRVLADEVPEQILADGGHFERTPGYHVRVLEVLEDAAKYADEPWLRRAIERMRAFLDAITPPNGRLPLLKDTTLVTRTAASPAQSRWLADSGFAVIANGDDFLIADFGRVCPDYLPAHAHADMFSFELTIGGAPVIVDSGVYEYAAGEWRSWFRSTAAHNTVEIDGHDQSEMWGSFRVGRRAHPRNVAWTEDAQFVAISGEHDGYAPVIHHRTILKPRDARLWIIIDRISGSGAARSYLHLHPDARPPHLATFGGALRETRGWYSERFGEKRENRVLILETQAPAIFGYVLSADHEVTATLRGDGAIEVASGNFAAIVRVEPPAPPSLQRIR